MFQLNNALLAGKCVLQVIVDNAVVAMSEVEFDKDRRPIEG
jgi:hypothetical protein